MQTFLPYDSFIESFKVLDYRRLGKQRVEAMQIIQVLEGKTSSWSKHPAVKMWEGYLESLKSYHNFCIDEWIRRGYKNNMKYYEVSSYELPWWFGNEDFHRSMRSRLIEKNRDFYLPKFPDDDGFNDSKYLWPVNETKTFRMI